MTTPLPLIHKTINLPHIEHEKSFLQAARTLYYCLLLRKQRSAKQVSVLITHKILIFLLCLAKGCVWAASPIVSGFYFLVSTIGHGDKAQELGGQFPSALFGCRACGLVYLTNSYWNKAQAVSRSTMVLLESRDVQRPSHLLRFKRKSSTSAPKSYGCNAMLSHP